MRPPLIVILGCTGTGKSRLALELALRFGGEVISADSMQVYEGLDVVTNKVSPDQLKLCKHHFIGCMPTFHEYSVLEFRNAALPLIERLISTGVMPIVVGGTNYYIESLLWNTLIDKPKESQPIPSSSGKVLESCELSLHEKLEAVDSKMAARLHPNDIRRIERSLEVFKQYGKPKSDILFERKEIGHGTGFSRGQLRFNDLAVLWIQCDYEVLDQRLDRRVDEMIQMGLKDDIHQLHHTSKLRGNTCLPTKGIFQAIGYKEFQTYLELFDEIGLTAEDCKLRLEEAFRACANSLKRATRTYARKQTSWIRNRFLKRVGETVPDVFTVDSTDIDKWDSNVLQLAERIIRSKCEGQPLPVKPLDRIEGREETWTHHVCDVCEGHVLRSDYEWEVHLRSRVHRRRMKTIKKQKQKPHTDISTNCRLSSSADQPQQKVVLDGSAD